MNVSECETVMTERLMTEVKSKFKQKSDKALENNSRKINIFLIVP